MALFPGRGNRLCVQRVLTLALSSVPGERAFFRQGATKAGSFATYRVKITLAERSLLTMKKLFALFLAAALARWAKMDFSQITLAT